MIFFYLLDEWMCHLKSRHLFIFDQLCAPKREKMGTQSHFVIENQAKCTWVPLVFCFFAIQTNVYWLESYVLFAIASRLSVESTGMVICCPFAANCILSFLGCTWEDRSGGLFVALLPLVSADGSLASLLGTLHPICSSQLFYLLSFVDCRRLHNSVCRA